MMRSLKKEEEEEKEEKEEGKEGIWSPIVRSDWMTIFSAFSASPSSKTFPSSV